MSPLLMTHDYFQHLRIILRQLFCARRASLCWCIKFVMDHVAIQLALVIVLFVKTPLLLLSLFFLHAIRYNTYMHI